MGQNILLVEGMADREFFSCCCNNAGLGKKIKVSPPKDLGSKEGGKGNAISLLPDLIQQMRDGSVTGLGLVVDADYEKTNGLGFAKTKIKVENIIKEHGYTVKKQNTRFEGFSFKHNDGFPDFGLWIMPDNRLDGFLEDFIKQSVVQGDSDLFNHAENTVAKLPNPKFKPIHVSKAEVATWMAWQTIPGQSLKGAIGGNLLNFDEGHAKAFIDWLKRIFAGGP